MKKRDRKTELVSSVLCVVLAALLCGAAQASDPQAPAGEVGSDEAAIMEAWKKVATPGDHHAHMAKAVGDWTFKGTFWMAPGAPPTKSTGTATIEPILGGRYFRTTTDGDFMGTRFQGMSIDGFDNGIQKHIGVWFDTAGTMMLTSEGTCEDGGRVTTTFSQFVDPMSGETKKTRNVTTILDENNIAFVMYELGASGAEHKTMTIEYTRK